MAIDNAELASADYWNHRYEEIGVEEAYDWFRDWEQLDAWFKDHLPRPHAKVLHLGCGNSVSLPCLIWVSTRNNVTSVAEKALKSATDSSLKLPSSAF